MKKLTAFISSLGGGGAQGVFVTVINYFFALGYRVEIVVDDLENDVHSGRISDGISIIELKVNSAKQELPKLIDYLRHNSVEVAFAFSPEIAVNLYLCKKYLGLNFPVIARCINTLTLEYQYAEGRFRRMITSRLVKHFYKKTDLVISQAENMRQDLIDNYGFRKNQVITINNPLSEKYDKCINIEQKRSNYILYVGRLEKQKGLEMLLQAFSMLENNNIELFLVGNGSKKTELRKMSESLGIDSMIRFIPFTTEIDSYYKNAVCTVLTSYFEGFPNVLIESIACGTPVVSYDLPSGPKDIIIPGVNGYLARYLDVDDFVMFLEKAINNKWDYEAIAETKKRFSRDKILLEYQKALSSFLDS